jgi:hypothetical protein
MTPRIVRMDGVKTPPNVPSPPAFPGATSTRRRPGLGVGIWGTGLGFLGLGEVGIQGRPAHRQFKKVALLRRPDQDSFRFEGSGSIRIPWD